MRLHCWGRAGQRVQGPGGPLGVWSLPKEKGPSRGFRRRRLHQSHVLERSLTAGWRTAQRGQNQIKLEAGGRGGGGWDSPGLARSPGPSWSSGSPGRLQGPTDCILCRWPLPLGLRGRDGGKVCCHLRGWTQAVGGPDEGSGAMQDTAPACSLGSQLTCWSKPE